LARDAACSQRIGIAFADIEFGGSYTRRSIVSPRDSVEHFMESMTESSSPHLERGLNLLHATSLNVANMLGAGPFITIPVLLGTMAGPQAMIGWILAMIIVMCDWLIWAELGAAFPGSGGTYHFLREIYRGSEWGRFLP